MQFNLEEVIQPGAITFGSRCAFCNGREDAEGDIGIQMGPGDIMEVPIGPNCLKMVQEKVGQVLDKDQYTVVE